jgi:solute carrier family 34 (sodium-dependent phosphate cotransporter)
VARIFPPPPVTVSDLTSDRPDAPEPDPRRGDPRVPTVSADPPSVAGASDVALSAVQDVAVEETTPRSWARVAVKVASGAAALFLFVLSLELMKAGASAVAPTIRQSVLFENGASTLGAGWLGAYLVLSGSPIAAVALGLFAGEAITELQTFAMLSGSRLGASFIVLLVGFLYAVRNRGANRQESVGMGILALSLTTIVYLPGMALGYWLLRSGLLDGIHWRTSGSVTSVVDLVWGPVRDLLTTNLPGWLLLIVGLGVILVSFKLLDRVLPQVDKSSMSGERAKWLRRPWPMFLLGCAVATLTLSVSVALVVLVPLASRGYVKREESIPYIMGANITTLADTLVAAMLLRNAAAVQIVLAQALGVFIVSMLYLALVYGPIKRGVIGLNDWLVDSNRRLWVFVVGLFVFPVLLLTSGIWLGPFGA